MTNDRGGPDHDGPEARPTLRLGLGSQGGPDGGDASRPPWVLPTAIGVAVLLIGGLALLASRDGSGDDAATSSTESTVAVSSTGPAVVTESTTATGDTADAVGSTIATAATTTIASGAAPTTTPSPTTAPGADPAATTPAAPTTAVPSPTSPAAPIAPNPGTAVVGGATLTIESACEETPFGPDEPSTVASYLVRDETSGRVLIERTEGTSTTIDVRYVDAGSSSSATEIEDLGGGGFRVTAAGPDGSPTEVALAPPEGGIDICLDTIELEPTDGGSGPTYLAGILDVCTVQSGSGLAVAGLGTGGTTFTVVPATGDSGGQGDGSGGATVTLTVTAPAVGGPLTDPNATADGDVSVVFFDGIVTGGGIARAAFVEVELAAPRTCSPIEAP